MTERPSKDFAERALNQWADAAKNWEAHRINKRMTAWESCGLQLWVGLHQALAELARLRGEMVQGQLGLPIAALDQPEEEQP